LRAVKDQQADCIIVAPVWPRPSAALWGCLTIRACVRGAAPEGSLVPLAKRRLLRAMVRGGHGRRWEPEIEGGKAVIGLSLSKRLSEEAH